MAITAEERSQIIALTVGMFGAAPGAAVLSELTTIVDGGVSIATLAEWLAASNEFNSLYPNFLTTEEFATNFTENLLGDTLAAADEQWVVDYITAQLNAGRSRASLIIEAITALATGDETDPLFGTAVAQFNNQVEVATYYSVNAQLSGSSLQELQDVIGGVTSDDATVTDKIADIDNEEEFGQTFTLTSGVDTILGTSAADVIDGTVAATGGTLTSLDSIDGAAGTDTLNINHIDGAFPSGLNITNVENAVYRSATNATVDSTTWSGLTSLSVTQATDVDVTAASTTAVTVSGSTGVLVDVDGGSDVTVTASNAQDVNIGATTRSSGAVSVTHTKQADGNIAVDGGTDVTVAASGVTTGEVRIGQGGAAADQPSGDVAVTSTGAAYVATTGAITLGDILVTGGDTVTVTQSATSSSAGAAADTTADTVTQGDVVVTGGADTTSVSITQDSAVTAKNAVAAVAGVKEVQVLTFSSMAAADVLTINGLTFTASKALTAAQVAAAFADLSNGSTQGSAAAGNGVYSGTFNTISGSTSAVTTTSTASTVSFTSTSSADVAALTIVGADATITATTNGSAATTGVTGVMGVVGGDVTVEGNITGADVLATVSLTGYGAGSTVDSDALTSLSLANSKADLVVTNTAATSLGLALNNVGTGSSLDIGSVYTSLNITADGANSDVTLVAGGVQTLTVAGTKSVDLTGATLSALKTVTVSGSAGLTVDASGATVTAVDTTATTGTVTATVDASKATYAGGAGVDKVTLSSTTVSKAVNTGAGDDSVTLATGTTSLTEVIVAGEGTDTLVMAGADAETVTVSSVFETKIDGFEKLSVTGVAGAQTDTVDLSNLDDINYVIVGGGGATAAVAEVFTATFGTVDEVGGDTTVAFDGVTVTYPVGAMTAIAAATKFATDYNAAVAATWTAVDNGNGTVTFTSDTAGVETDILTADFVVTQTTADTDAPDVTVAAPTTQGAAAVASGNLTLTKMADGGTLEFAAAATTTTVTMADATGTADTFNIVTKVSTASTDFGTVAVAGVETVNITATDTSTTGGIQTATLVVSDTAVKSVVVTGNGDLSLTAAGASLTSVDASALTGDLTFSSAVNTATVTGGSGTDQLTATGNNQTLIGGDGADTLTVTGELATLTGGAGNDIFDVSNPTTNVNSYATITDLTAGDVIRFDATAADFVSAKVTLGDTAVFQDLANAAIANSDTGDLAWFQFSGNTYVIQNESNGASFVNDTDIIVKIAGQVDLSTASFSSSADTLLII